MIQFHLVSIIQRNWGKEGEYTLYLYNGDSYFITNDNNDYLGYLEVRDVSSGIERIAYADSNMEGGFYKTMFSTIFKFGKVKELYSDISVSENAFKAYSNLVKKKLFNIQVVTDKGEYLPFNKKNLTADDYNRVSTKPL